MLARETWLGWAAACVVAALACAPACRSSDGSDDDGVTASSSSGSGGSVMLPAPQPLKVLNWNVQNFVNNTLDDNGASMEGTDPNYLQHRGAIGAVLRALDADVVMLQEVEHEAIVADLNDAELGGAYEVRVIDANDPRGIEVGVMSKLPLESVITHKDEPFTKAGTQTPTYYYARDALEVHTTFNGRPLVFLGVHYRAKSMDDPDKRLAEAQHTRAIADAIVATSPEVGVIILGDFNDTPGSPPYDATVGSAPNAYRDVTVDLAAAERWSYDFMGTLELVDQQMANPLMAERLDAASVRILHGPEVESASDHAPIIATYQVN